MRGCNLSSQYTPIFSWKTGEVEIQYHLAPSKLTIITGERIYSQLPRPYEEVIRKIIQSQHTQFLGRWENEVSQPLTEKGIREALHGVINSQRILDKILELEAERIFWAGRNSAKLLEF